MAASPSPNSLGSDLINTRSHLVIAHLLEAVGEAHDARAPRHTAADVAPGTVTLCATRELSGGLQWAHLPVHRQLCSEEGLRKVFRRGSGAQWATRRRQSRSSKACSGPGPWWAAASGALRRTSGPSTHVQRAPQATNCPECGATD